MMLRKSKAQGVFSMRINGHLLTGEKRLGKWQFKCDWLDIAESNNGSKSPDFAIDQFVARAIDEVVTVIRSTSE